MEYTNAAVINRENSPGVNIMPPLVFFSFLIVGGILEFFWPLDFWFMPKYITLIPGIVIGVGGFGFMLIAHNLFERLGTNVPTNLPATQVVDKGAYGFSRNPMYFGGSLFFIGLGISVGSLWMVASYIPLGLYLQFYVIPREEAYMEREFGEAYIDYRKRVRRWI